MPIVTFLVAQDKEDREFNSKAYYLLGQAATEFAENGWTARVGRMEGNEEQVFDAYKFENPASTWKNKEREKITEHVELPVEEHVPWEGFNTGVKKELDRRGYTAKEVIASPEIAQRAETLARGVNENWDTAKPATKKFQIRGITQILGADLQTPANLVIVSAKEFENKPNREMATALKIAENTNTVPNEHGVVRGIGIVRLDNEQDLEIIKSIIKNERAQRQDRGEFMERIMNSNKGFKSTENEQKEQKEEKFEPSTAKIISVTTTKTFVVGWIKDAVKNTMVFPEERESYAKFAQKIEKLTEKNFDNSLGKMNKTDRALLEDIVEDMLEPEDVREVQSTLAETDKSNTEKKAAKETQLTTPSLGR